MLSFHRAAHCSDVIRTLKLQTNTVLRHTENYIAKGVVDRTTTVGAPERSGKSTSRYDWHTA